MCIERHSNTADSEHFNQNYEIESDSDLQRVAINSSNDTDDSEMPLSFSHDTEVETSEEYKKNSMCRL